MCTHTLFVSALLSRSHDLRNIGLSTSLMLPNVFYHLKRNFPTNSHHYKFGSLFIMQICLPETKYVTLTSCSREVWSTAGVTSTFWWIILTVLVLVDAVALFPTVDTEPTTVAGWINISRRWMIYFGKIVQYKLVQFWLNPDIVVITAICVLKISTSVFWSTINQNHLVGTYMLFMKNLRFLLTDDFFAREDWDIWANSINMSW